MLKKIISVLIAAMMCSCVCFAEDTVFDTLYSGFSSVGSWSNTALIGYEGNFILSTNAGENISAQWDMIIESGEYDVYIWRCLKDTGCPKALAEIIADETYVNEFSMAYGVTGWLKIGSCNTSDGKVTVKIKGNEGTLMASAVRLVPVQKNTAVR